jgi:hypothetical protein
MRPKQSSTVAPRTSPEVAAPDSLWREPLGPGAEGQGGKASALADPDFAVSLRLDAHAPRSARYYVAHVDRPSPDLRDAVMLITSELVTRALQQHEFISGEDITLRVWMPADIVRVEIQGSRSLLPPPRLAGEPHDGLLIDKLADRWSMDTHERHACAWFEIDRHRSGSPPACSHSAS